MNEPDSQPQAATGTLWLTAVTAVLLLVAGVLGQAEHAMIAWMICNAALAVWVAVAVVFRFRVMWRARGTVVRSAALAGFLGVLLLASKAASLNPQGAGDAISLAMFLVVLPVLFLAGLGVGWVGGALAWWSAGGAVPRNRVIRHGITLFWVLLIASAVATGVCWKWNPVAAAAMAKVFSGGLPFLTVWLSPVLRRAGERQFPLALHDWMRRWLVYRRSTSAALDLRVPACAVAAFVFASGLHWLGALDLLRYNTLLKMVRQQISYERLTAPYRNAQAAKPGDNRTPRDRDRVVILSWDHAAVFDAGVTRSIHHVQADLIRRVSAHGASRIVIPLLPPSGAETEEGASAADGVREADGLSQMLAAARASGKVVFLLPPGVNDPAAAGIAAADQNGLQFATGDPGGFGLKELCSVPLHWDSAAPPPAPWVLADPVANPALVRQPCISPGTILTDFTQARPGADIPRLPASAVLRGQAVPWKDESGKRRWTRPDELLKGRIVFLDTMDSTPVPCPVGELSAVEIAAHATLTLMDRSGPQGMPAWAGYLCALVLSLAAGHLSSRHGLLGGLVRTAGVVLVVFVASGVALVSGRWFDPVLPSAAAMCAFLLVSQLTFVLESRAKQENRALLQRFVAPEVVHELLEDPDQVMGLRGRRERIIVLFADVRGFSRFAGEHSPEDVVRAINAYLHQMTDALNHHGGLLDKYTGDGLMALFRTGSDESEAVNRAVAAALAMRDAVIRVSEDRMAEGDSPLQVGIALHVGEAVVGLVGNPVHQINYTALGHAVVVAARLQGHAMGGEVLVTDAARQFLSDRFTLVERPAVYGKGLAEPVACWSVVGPVGSHPTT